MTVPASDSHASDSRASDSRAALEARAHRLARRVEADAAATFSINVVIFSVARERFAVEARFVFAVFHIAELVPLPGAHAPVVGLTRWRGDVLTVLDLRRVLGGSTRALDDLTRVVVIGSTIPAFGVLADAVEDLSSLDPTTLHTLPTERRLEIPGLLRGVTPSGVHVLDAGVLIAHQDGALTISAASGSTISSISDQL